MGVRHVCIVCAVLWTVAGRAQTAVTFRLSDPLLARDPPSVGRASGGPPPPHRRAVRSVGDAAPTSSSAIIMPDSSASIMPDSSAIIMPDSSAIIMPDSYLAGSSNTTLVLRRIIGAVCPPGSVARPRGCYATRNSERQRNSLPITFLFT